MSFILTLIMAFTLGFTGSQAPAQTPSQAPSHGLIQALESQASHTPSSLRCEEDMPCWDCHTMGNHICGPSQAPLVTVSAPLDHITAPTGTTASFKAPAQALKKSTASLIKAPTAKGATEAWKKFDPSVFTEDELSKPFRVTYRGTTTAPNNLPNGHEWYTVPASGKTHHVFEIEFNSK